MGAVSIIYNLPDTPDLRLTPKILSSIFLGDITQWSDAAIRSANPATPLPDTKITVVHRSEGSGTTFILSDYLTKTNTDWATRVGRGKSLKWPAGIGVEGNSGVADMVRRVPGAIGYVSLNYAEKNALPVAMIKNRTGRFIKPTLSSVSAAANVDLPEDTRLLITDSHAPSGYPISAFTYLIFYRDQGYDQRSREQAQALSNLINWIIHDGQQYNRKLFYAPLPEEAVRRAEHVVDSMMYYDRPLKPLRQP